MRKNSRTFLAGFSTVILILSHVSSGLATEALGDLLVAQSSATVSPDGNAAQAGVVPATDFFQTSALAAATACLTAMCGVSSGGTVSGIIFVQPNLDLNPSIRKISYYLNGTLSDRQYSAPFIWGGAAGFNTANLQDGTYTLGGAYTTSAGDQAFSISFTVNNSTPSDTTAPIISGVNPTHITTSSVTINWITNEAGDSQIQYRVQGASTWITLTLNTTLTTNHSAVLTGLNAGTIYQYQVLSRDQAGNLATQAAIATLTTTAAATGDFVGVTDGATVSGVVSIGPNLIFHPSIRKVSYYLNGAQSGRVYASPFLWGGPVGNGTAGFDTTALTDGNYSLGIIYTDNTGDHTISVNFIVNNSGAVDNTVPVISGVGSTNITITGATINWATNEASDSQVEYRVQGQATWQTSALNAALVTNHSLTLSGLTANTTYEYRVKSRDAVGNLATQTPALNFVTFAPPATDFTGLTEGQTVSGNITVQPNLTLHPGIRKVSYYLNGAQSGKYYAAPFTWGGTGFNTNTLTNGNYTLAGAYTDATGDHFFSINFIVNNSGQVDNMAPVISGVGSTNATIGGVTINWSTNESSNSQVQYRVQGQSTWQSSALNSSMVMNHSLNLSGLNSNTTYEYRVLSRDAAGNLATQANISTFTTQATGGGPFAINGLAASELTATGITFTWTTNLASDTQLDYRELGSSTWRRWAGGTNFVTSHSLSVIRFNSNTTYEYRVVSQTQDGITVASPFSTFTTLIAPTTAPIYMFGDSIIKWTDWQANLNRLDVINGGVVGHTTTQFLNRMQNVYAAQPEIAFVMGGSNDFVAGASVQTVYNNMVQIVQNLIAHNIRPVIVSTTHVDVSLVLQNQQVTQLNALLQAYATNQNLDYVDIDSQISVDEHSQPQYTVDGEHFNQAAYDIWATQILSILEKYGI